MNAPSVFAAPAKLNLSLLVTGRRADGYHLLQTVFRFIDFADQIHLMDVSSAPRRWPGLPPMTTSRCARRGCCSRPQA